MHFLRAQVELPNEEQVRVELVFGSLYSEEIGTELTALLMAKDGSPPKPQDMQGWLEKSGQPLDVVAIEKGPVDLFFIREKSPATLEALTGIYRRFRRDRANSRWPHEPRTLLQKNDRLRFVLPTGESPTQEPERLVVGQGATPILIEEIDVSLDVAEVGRLYQMLTQFVFSDQPFTRTHEELRS